MSAAASVDFSAFLNHEDAGVRGRAWAWQSAQGLLVVEGLHPSAYLVETARRHMEGAVPIELVGKLVDAYYLMQKGAVTEAADRRVLDMVRLLGASYEQAAAAPAAPAAVEAAPPAEPAPVDAASLHLRQKRLLRTLGPRTLGVPELLKALRLSTRQSFMRVWVTPAIEMGLVKPLHPESPRHPQQKYLLTRKGQRFLKELTRK